jgi:hypothetical protein
MASRDTITLMDPSAEDVPEEHPLARRLSSLQGATIGLVDNTKHNSDRFLAEVGELLRHEYGVTQLVHLRKANANTPAPPALLDQVASPCDAVIHAVAD